MKKALMKEKDLEKIFREAVQKAGGWMPKWTSPGNDGVPDRIVFLPEGRIVFVELKTEAGKASKRQQLQIRRLYRLGQDARILYGLRDVAGFLQEFGMASESQKLLKKAEELERDL